MFRREVKDIKELILRNLRQQGLEMPLLQQRLVEAGSDLRCDVLQVPHHGADNALCEALLDLARPQTAVISCGKNNDYGHPHRAVLSALSQRGANIYRTDEHSHITVSCYADGYRVDTAK